MKKLFLLSATILVGLNSGAQEASPLSVAAGSAKQAIQPKVVGNPLPSAKSSIAGGRWYNHAAMVSNVIAPGQMEVHLLPIWFDSTVTQNYIDGPGTVNYSSLGQVVDPIHFALYNDIDASPDNANDIAITMQQPYKVDSIAFGAYYVENPSRPATVVDTFIFSVSTSGNDVETPVQIRYDGYTNWTNNGYTAPGDTTKGFRIVPSDSINRASGVNGVVMWKVPIDTSFRRPDSAGFVFYRDYTYPVMVNGNAGSVDIPAGRTAAVTVTFKSGDNSIAGDSIYAYHHIFMRSGEGLGANTTSGVPMPYYHYLHNDYNSSNLMFSTAPAFYAATVIIEGHNQTSFRNEFHDLSVHLTCDNCPTVTEFSSVHNVSGNVAANAVAYPNPANNEINVLFTLDQNTDATVSITNAVGQVIATQEVAGVIAKKDNKVTFSTANLSAGIYFYTVEAKGQRTTNRFVVTH